MVRLKQLRLGAFVSSAVLLASCGGAEASPPSGEAVALYEQGRILERRRLGAEDVEAAIALYERAVEADDDFLLGYVGLARAHAAMVHFSWDPTPERRAQSREAAQHALQLAPQSGEAHYAMGTYWYQGEKNYERALAELEIAGRALPEDAEIQALSGYVQRRMGRYEQMAALVARAAALEPDNHGYHLDLGDTYEALGRTEESLAAWAEAHRLLPEGHHDVSRARVILRTTGETEPLRQALAAVPAGFDPDGAMTAARYELAWEEQNADAAIRALEGSATAALANQNHYWPLSLLAGRAHRLAGRAERARAAFDSARVHLEAQIAARPDDARLHVSLGSALANLGRTEEAARAAERALELMPPSRDALIAQYIERQVAMAHAEAGNADRAVQLLEHLFGGPVFNYSRRQLATDPIWEKVRGHAGFRRLVTAQR